MIVSGPVTVVICGRRVDAALGARLEGGVVVAPLAPFVRDIAEAIDGNAGRRLVLRRGSHSVALAIGRTEIRTGDSSARLPVAPFLDEGEPVVPLAAIARALGASVDYDAASRTLSIVIEPEPLVTMTPFVRYQAPPEPPPTFTPKPATTPQPAVTGEPQPRRTPIVVKSKR
ncbi:MAG: copper amine oxidase N-terminal domain-containing protein [Candidatus Eremiobacteraeota bacterium]|nr:copper amine oxidase N-terminal domain-containing protein [Candidatus Eremiobacteraeota bacterium]